MIRPLLIALCASCIAPPVESPPTTVTMETRVRVAQNVRNKVDILFLIDNSSSMSPKQAKLSERLPQFIAKLRGFADGGHAASYHIGVVTSDLGAGHSDACVRGGDGARLNTADRSDPRQPKSCRLGGSVHYLDFNQLDGTSNVPADLTVEQMFQCIATVGDGGCGFEHQLESVRRALRDPIAENAGFLRDDAILAVVFLTDEDDCSAPADSDLFDLDKSGTDFSLPGNYGPRVSYRCTQFGLLCGDPARPLPFADTHDQPLQCAPAPFSAAPGPGKLYGVDEYIDFFTQLKPHKDDVILVSIAGPTAGGVQTLLANPNTTGAYTRCGAANGTTCTPVLQRSCHADGNPDFVGDPALRIHAVVDAVTNHDDTTSICDDSYAQALDRLGELIIVGIGAGCLGSPIANPDHPDCVVEDVVHHQGAPDTRSEIPACAPGVATPCWKLATDARCPKVHNPLDDSDEQLGLTIDRGPGGQPPRDSEAQVACATIASRRQ